MQRNRKKDIAVIANKVITASYSLEETEKKLILAILGSISPTLTTKEQTHGGVILAQEGEEVNSHELYTIRVAEYATLYGMETCDARKLLKHATITLFERHIMLKEGKKTTYFRWVQKVVFDDEDDTVGLVWSNDIVPFISQLTSNFTQFKLEKVAKLKGKYSLRLYELVVSRSNEKAKRFALFTLEELYFAMALPPSLTNYAEFKRVVLTPATKSMKEIVPIKYIEIKEKRKVVALEFALN